MVKDKIEVSVKIDLDKANPIVEEVKTALLLLNKHKLITKREAQRVVQRLRQQLTDYIIVETPE